MAVRYVEYIQSSGTQYIDTGFKPNNNTRIVMEAELTDYSTNTYGNSFFGVRADGSTNAFVVICGTSATATWTLMYGNNSGNLTLAAAGKHSIDFNKNVCTVDGSSVTITASTFSSAYSCFLFTDSRLGAANTGNNARMKLYSCKIYDNGTLIRDYAPCLDADGVACLYDKVSKGYVYNKGTGTFAAGEELAVPAVDFGTVCRMPLRIAKLKDGVNYVEYIGSDGTQYIDTGFVPNQDTRVVCEFDYTTEGYVFGAEVAYKNKSYDFFNRFHNIPPNIYNRIIIQQTFSNVYIFFSYNALDISATKSLIF